LQKGLQLRINAQGLIEGKRQRFDGCVILGSQDYGAQGEVLNDFIIPADDSGIGSRHLMIKYDSAERDYFIKDLGDGSGTFVKVERDLVSSKFINSKETQNRLYNFLRRHAHAGLNSK